MPEEKKEGDEYISALKVQDGIEPPVQVNASAVSRFKESRKNLLSAEEYFQAIRS